MPTNRIAIYSLGAALLTVISFCIGFAPIPMTAPFCYPTAVILGIVALVAGFRALKQMRTSGENGRWLALTGIGVGGVSILAVICASTISLLILYYGVDYLQTVWPTPLP
jgi:FtsH-binding integral membrane protein